MGDAVAAAREDEASQQKLASSLKANVPAWDGNTSAIEATLAARMRLGFSDDEQRDSLAHLVAATHDSTKALEIQRTAMDLARFKGISLGDATEALTKVEAGSYRILKSLGIVLKDGATAQDALTAVQKVATGQAEDYANTNEGKLLTSQVKLSEAMETLGYVIMPAVTSVIVTASDVAVEASKHFGLLGDAAGFVAKGFGVITAPIDLASHAISDLTHTTEAAADHTQDASEHIRGAFSAAGAAATTFASRTERADRRVEKSLSDLAKTAVSDYFDPIITHDRLLGDAAELAAQKKILASKKSTAAEIADAKARVHELQKSVTEERIALFEAGRLSKGQQAALLKDLRYDWAHSTGQAKADIASLIAKISQLQHDSGVRITVQPGNAHIGGKAAGGPVSGGTTYLVGEKGPELFTPGTSGSITPNDALGGGGGASGAPVVIQLQVDGRVLAEIVDRQLYYAQARAPRTAAAS